MWRLVSVLIIFPLFLPVTVKATVFINELLPNPQGDDVLGEWVELYNSSSEVVDLTDYQLVDDKGNVLTIDLFHIFDSSMVINANSFTVIERNGHAKFSLNNDTDNIRLIDGNGNEVDRFEYSGCEEGKSWGRFPDGNNISGQVMQPTKGESNVFAISVETAKDEVSEDIKDKAICNVNSAKDEKGNILTSVKIYVDGNYIHHFAPETIEFCEGCDCDGYTDCGFGMHTIMLEKSGFINWTQSRAFNAGDLVDMDPVLTVLSHETNTPAPNEVGPSIEKKEEATEEYVDSGIDNSEVQGIQHEMPVFHETSSQDENVSDVEVTFNKKSSPITSYLLIAGGLSFIGAAAYPIISRNGLKFNGLKKILTK